MKRKHLIRKSLPRVEVWEAMLAAGLLLGFGFSSYMVVAIVVAILGGK